MGDSVTGWAVCAGEELPKLIMRLRRAPLLGVTGELKTSWAEGELGDGKTRKQNGKEEQCKSGHI